MKWKTLQLMFFCLAQACLAKAQACLAQARYFLFGIVVVLSLRFIPGIPCELAIADDKITTEANPLAWQQDAELTSVCFLTTEIGWAVGAQGVILRTINGGREWKDVGDASAGSKSELSLQQKFQAIQSGTRSEATGIADGSSSRDRKIRCRFESVCFIDERHGWVAGGFDVPYLDHSRGVILKTTDGGVSWRRIEGAFIPRLKRIHFTDQRNGWAIGECGNLMADSTFHTNDGGESWNEGPLMAAGSSSGESSMEYDLLDADQIDQRMLAVSREGQPLLFRGNGLQRAVVKPAATSPADSPSNPDADKSAARFTSVRMLDSVNGWAVGMRGGVWRTSNGGTSWEPLAETSSTLGQQLKVFDFNAIAISPNQIWFGGSPGTQVFSIDRSSGAIQSSSTGSSLPITSMHFVDDQNGWIVGSLGMILATRDGGKSWMRQRGQFRSVAMLGVAVQAEEVPLEVLAQFSCEYDSLVATAIFQDAVSPAAMQAVERLGGTAMYAIGAGADSAREQNWELERLERLVRLIRILRPQVLICNADIQQWPQGREGEQFEPSAVLSQAVNAAGNREFFPEQISIGYLEPWTVPRIAIRLPGGSGGSMSIDPQKMLIRSGSPLVDRIAISRALIGMPLTSVDKLSYRIESQGNVLHVNEAELFKGLSAAPKRPANNLNRLNRVALESANQKQKKLIEYSRLDGKTDQDFLIWGQQIEQWIQAQDEMLAGISLSQLAEQYLHQGKFELAAQTLELLTNRLIGHPLEPAAQMWLARYYASDENNLQAWKEIQERDKPVSSVVARSGSREIQVGRSASKAHWAQQNGQAVMVWVPVSDELEIPERKMQKSSLGDLGKSSASAETAVGSELSDEVSMASTTETVEAPETGRQQFYSQRWRRASRHLVSMGGRDPDYVHHPQYRWLEARLTEKLKGLSVAESTLKKFAISRNDHGLRTAAIRELQLSENLPGTERAIKFSNGVSCLRSTSRPKLDGRFDDPIWQAVIEQGLTIEQRHQSHGSYRPNTRTGNGWTEKAGNVSAFSQKSDRIMFARDDEYLYVGMTCQKLPGQLYPPSNQARPRDADLALRDRVRFSFDIDRDYQSAFQFSVDCRGWCRDELNGSPGWNPQWFIAQSESENDWQVELAIPLKEVGGEFLSAQSKGPGQDAVESRNSTAAAEVWAIRMERKGLAESDLWQPVPTDSSDGKVENVEEKPTVSPRNRSGKQGLYQNLHASPDEFRLFVWN